MAAQGYRNTYYVGALLSFAESIKARVFVSTFAAPLKGSQWVLCRLMGRSQERRAGVAGVGAQLPARGHLLPYQGHALSQEGPPGGLMIGMRCCVETGGPGVTRFGPRGR